jgi:hypothetical protein
MKKIERNMREGNGESNVETRLTGGRDGAVVGLGRTNGINQKALTNWRMKEGMDFDPGKKESGKERKEREKTTDRSADSEFGVEFGKNVELSKRHG